MPSHAALAETIGSAAADALYVRFVQSYAVHVARLDPEMFENFRGSALTPATALAAYEAETDEAFPQDPAVQLAEVLRSMARAWEGTTARLLRTAKGAPADAGLGLVVQAMALGLGPAESGAGVIQFVDGGSGLPQIIGRYRSQAQGRDALSGQGALYLTRDPRGASLEELCPGAFADLIDFGALGAGTSCAKRCRSNSPSRTTLCGFSTRSASTAIRAPR